MRDSRNGVIVRKALGYNGVSGEAASWHEITGNATIFDEEAKPKNGSHETQINTTTYSHVTRS
ncbi:hypothetical protein, partial [Mycobacterium avium]|uniref:hypothetical protein n=1 Tax=Mycobacterium avium TaxID=1764 RepID=UPI001F168BB2